ncbi:MAG: bifunctional phosphoribosylaminoimidazolecarboxamide formyltransferase/IMP cyclohydrolase [Actinomycetota bacterium]|nr:bifunctional phosphoribosylaminoimidazolecarboxamide formyltransferase/IMP cyclohydrolase [Actinomycetota bacterium]
MSRQSAPGDVVPVRQAIVSVWDKAGLPALARGLAAAGARIVSTGSTARAVRAAGVEVTEVSEITGFPEIMDGRVKTLHPAVHAGILADRDRDSHLAALTEHAIVPFELVVANLYPFRAAVLDSPAADPAQAIEMIDVGGPTMVRAAAKNHRHVAVAVDPADYPALLEELAAHGGVTAATRRQLAAKAFAHTAAYDADVAAWFARGQGLPSALAAVWRKREDLRYGENPHQRAAYYVERGSPWGLASARQLHGKELSYNNLLDADAAWAMAADFTEPCVAIVKHTNPAGLAVADSLAEAHSKALASDPLSAFGGIVAANRVIDADTAGRIVDVFTEVVVAPGYGEGALQTLRRKKNLRVLQLDEPQPPAATWTLRSVAGGLLVQEPDAFGGDAGWTVPTAAKPGDDTMRELRFAWRVCRHVKSNAIVLAAGEATVGVGAGQMSRVDSVRLAVDKSQGRSRGAVLASDAFFPFRDATDAAIDAGVVAIVQPGGSVGDRDVIASCDERGVPMVFTGRRHFRH